MRCPGGFGPGAASARSLGEWIEPSGLESDERCRSRCCDETRIAVHAPPTADDSTAGHTHPSGRYTPLAGAAQAGAAWSAARTALELVDHVAVELHRRVAVIGRRPLGDDRDPPARAQGQLGQPGDRVDLERRADAEQQVGALARAPAPRASPRSGSSSPNRTTSGLTLPMQQAQVATPSSSNSSPTVLQRVAGAAGRAARGRDRAVDLDHPLRAGLGGAAGRCSG